MVRRTTLAFTLPELLVIVGIIAVLISILLPSLARAREASRTMTCLSNLHQLGEATALYGTDHAGFLPFPTTGLGERELWYNVLDPYLQAQSNGSRTGVAKSRSYREYKQCVVYASFDGGQNSGAQDKLKEYSRTYKMNVLLRHNNPDGPARVVEVPNPSNFVYLGDGNSLDQTGPIEEQWENGQFSMEVNDKSQAGPALRHGRDGANILFVDGHAETEYLPTFTKSLRRPNNSITVKSWESEFVNAAGNPVSLPDHFQTAEQQGLRRNPNMPLQWSVPGRLYD